MHSVIKWLSLQGPSSLNKAEGLSRNYHFPLSQVILSQRMKNKPGVGIFIFHFPKFPIFFYDLSLSIAKQEVQQNTIPNQIEDMLSDGSK